MSDPLAWLTDELHDLDVRGLRRTRREVRPLPGGRCELAGRTLWNFAANDYLGLAGDPTLIATATEALRDSGAGARASALVCGRTPWHARLEQRLAEFKETDAAILFPTGYAANVGVLTALAEGEDVVFCDRLNHASLIDGCRLSGAKFRVYSHADLPALWIDLARFSGARRRFIVTDSLFSMDGDAAPLAELLGMAEQLDALLVVDEAHATGVFSERGTGLVEELIGRKSDRVIAIGTLSKALGAQGGFVAGPQSLIDWLWNSARMQMFSTALSPALCAAAWAAIDCIQQQPQRRVWLRNASHQVAESLRAQGWQVPDNVVGPILPVLVGEPADMLKLASELEALGVLVAGIRPPTVPRGTSRLRISLSCAHGEEGIEALQSAFAKVRTSRRLEETAGVGAPLGS